MPAVSQKRELSPLDEEPKSKMEPSCKPQSSEACHIVNSICLLILSGRMKENKSATCISLNQQVLIDITNLPVYIGVYGKATNNTDDNNNILIEKWLIQSVSSQCESNIAETAAKTSIQFLTQAVKSFLYFSQINSWTVSNDGELPFHLQHRVHATNSTDTLQFSSPTETHNFPLVPIDSLSQYINISVTYLSRLEEIPSQLLPYMEAATAVTNISIDNGSILKNPPLTEAVVSIQPVMINTSSDDCANQLETNNTSSLLLLPNDSLENSGFPFSPPNPSPLSHKCIPNLNQNSTNTNTIDQLTCPINNGQSTIKNDCTDISCYVQQLSLTSSDHKNSSNGSGETHSDSNSRTSSSASRIIISKLNKTSSIRNNITKTVSVNGNTKLNNPLHNVSVSRYTGMRSSGASSPIPFQFRRHSCVDSTDKALKKKLKRRSCGVYSKSTSCPPPPMPTRSMSLPAVVPNLCLLGTFEESVLNGRIEPLGYVEGFTAELGASGSFCPQHVTLPVTTSFFSLSDDGGPSQYLGHIDLSGLKKRGYHIPRMGTVQLTLFNPNKTVVKIFIIIYDHSDMPPNTTTFIRQKTQSRPSYNIDSGIVKELVLPSLQYLIHLRFLSSKSGHVYLHTDIKILFARRAPDTDPDLSKVSLYTMLEGPCNPKYGPLTKELC